MLIPSHSFFTLKQKANTYETEKGKKKKKGGREGGREGEDAQKGWFALSWRNSSQSRKKKECACVCTPCGTKAAYLSPALLKSPADICQHCMSAYKQH